MFTQGLHKIKEKINSKNLPNIILGISTAAIFSGFVISNIYQPQANAGYETAFAGVSQVTTAALNFGRDVGSVGTYSAGYAIYVDGELIGTLPKDEADKLNEYLNKKLYGENTLVNGEIHFKEKISFVSGDFSQERFSSAEELEKILSGTKSDGKTPFLNVVEKYTSVSVTTVPYNVIEEESSELAKGDIHVSTQGSNGLSQTVTEVTKVNGETTTENIVSEEIIQEPVDEIVDVGTAEFSNLMWPVGGSGGYVSSIYGYRSFDDSFHKGIDIAGVAEGTDIYAVYSGTVVRSELNQNGYGNFIVIDHGNGYCTAYAHMSFRNVSVGDTVSVGEVIGGIGTTGDSTGIHLHFEVRWGDEFRNPANFLERDVVEGQ